MGVSYAGYAPLITALYIRDADMVYLLLENLASLECKDEYNNTPLHLVSKIDDGGKCLKKMLGDKRSQKLVTSKNDQGMTPLLSAVENQSLKSVEILLEAGSRLTEHDTHHRGVLHIAASQNNFNLALLEMLIRYTDQLL
jgi:ankyrin repeat protein